jgi:signal transduction histidine kinase
MSSPKRVHRAFDARAVKQALEDLFAAARTPADFMLGIKAFLATARAPRDLARVLQRASIAEDCLEALHEVRTLLTAVVANVENIARTTRALFAGENGGPSRRARDIAEVQICVDDLTACCDRVIAVALGSAATQAEKQRGSLRECLALVGRLVAKHTRESVTIAAAPDVTVTAPQGELLQVLLNLVRNAQEAIASVRDGEVKVTAWASPSMGFVSVADNGPGFAPGLLDGQPFATTKAQGLGLGLCICRRLVDGWGGTLQIESSPRDGAEVIVGIPRWRAA